jgi:hypothetical protein
MSLPETNKEIAQLHHTRQAAGPAENVVSTACPGCQTRFALVAALDQAGWHLRCTACGYHGDGELKT